MATNLAMYSLANSNIPKSAKRSLMRELIGKVGSMKRPGVKHVVHTGLDAVRGSGTAVITGGILGAVHASGKHGLDLGGQVPADVLLGIAGPVIAAFSEDHPVAAITAQDMGKSGFTVFGFREVYGLIAEKKLQAGGTPGGTFKPMTTKLMAAKPGVAKGKTAAHGEEEEDPILAIAKRRGFGR